MQLSPPYRSFPLPRIRCGLFLRPSMCRRYRAACPRFLSGGSPLCFCRRAAVVRQSAVVAGPLVRQGDALQIFGAAEPRSAPGFTDRAFRSGRRPDDGPYLRGIRIGNRTSEGGGASCSLYLGVIMLAGVFLSGSFGVSVVVLCMFRRGVDFRTLGALSAAPDARMPPGSFEAGLRCS